MRAVVFDWRGTLVSELTQDRWAREALRRSGRDHSDTATKDLLRTILTAAGEPNRLKDPFGNTSFERHRDTYYSVFADAGLPEDLAHELFAVDSDPSYNIFAVDAAETIAAVKKKGCRVAVASNIHFDIRPMFEAVGLLDAIDTFVLSNEEGVQKPDPAFFQLALDRLGTPAEHTLMVGDNASRDGAAVDVGMPYLPVPQLTDPRHRQLHLVTNAVARRCDPVATCARGVCLIPHTTRSDKEFVVAESPIDLRTDVAHPARDAGHARRRVPDPVIGRFPPTRQKVISLWTAAVATVILSTTGCGLSDNPYEKTNPADTQKAAARLAELPTLEDTETQLRAAVVELGSYVSSLVPGLTWQWVDERSVESCDRPYDQTQGSKVRLQNYVSNSGIPDTVWPQVLDRARRLADPLGVTGSEVFANKPGNHTVRLDSQEGTTIFLGTQGAVISSNTGCRLPQHDLFRFVAGQGNPASSGSPARSCWLRCMRARSRSCRRGYVLTDWGRVNVSRLLETETGPDLTERTRAPWTT
ncbi:LppA family lipoprotein [Nocardia miyunensis]|uniref:LppA family lipoprotein n=1 Tax=Nocardia miyunensis TaxID=282684 RepID=UPI00082D3F92|nr:LppA family lipoprotein [Nocardia miyunensis]